MQKMHETKRNILAIFLKQKSLRSVTIDFTHIVVSEIRSFYTK